MLYTIDKSKIENIPHKKDYGRWRRNLSDTQYVEIMTKMELLLDNGKVHVSSFIPGSNWDYPYLYIYKACQNEYQNAAYFFGLLMWEAVMKHADDWSFLKYDENDIKGMTYFKITLP